MIYVVVVAFVTIFFIGLLWYGLHAPLIPLVEDMAFEHPEYYDPLVTSFTVAVLGWFLIIFVFAVLTWVYVQSQRPQPWEIRV